MVDENGLYWTRSVGKELYHDGTTGWIGVLAFAVTVIGQLRYLAVCLHRLTLQRICKHVT